MSKKREANKPPGPATIQNRRARFDYEIVDTFEAGMVLIGSEVKSLWLGRANLTDAYVHVKSGELWMSELDIDPYDKASHFRPDRRRDVKLLMHKKEIELLQRRSQEKGLTIVPLKLYFKRGKMKVEVALARGKRQYDKRKQIAEKETRREVERARSERN